MKKKMSLEWISEKALYRFSNGDREIFFTHAELSFIQHQMERSDWVVGIEEEIDESEDNLVFDDTTREQFVELCLDELESKWENYTLNNDPDYEGIVFDVANENGVWRY